MSRRSRISQAALSLLIVLVTSSPASASAEALAELTTSYPGLVDYHEGDIVSRLYGVPFGSGPSASASAEAFCLEHADALGCQYSDLELGGSISGGATLQLGYDTESGAYKFTLVSYSQFRDAIPVFRSELKLLIRNEPNYPLWQVSSGIRDLGSYTVDPALAAINMDPIVAQFTDPEFPNMVNKSAPRRVIWAGAGTTVESPTLGIEFTADDGGLIHEMYLYVVDIQNSAILFKEDQVLSADVSGTVNGYATIGYGAGICGPLALRPLPYMRVLANGVGQYALSDGSFAFTGVPTGNALIESQMWGQWFTVTNIGGNGEEDHLTSTVTAPGEVHFEHNAAQDEFTTAQVNAYLHANIVRDFVLHYHPSYPGLSVDHLILEVNDESENGRCSGYYLFSKLRFGAALLGACANYAFSSIVYHEYGHHLVHRAGSAQGQYGEGMASTTAILVTDERALGRGAQGNCNNHLQDPMINPVSYPCADPDETGHYCGQILQGCVWRLREELVQNYPTTYRDLLAALVINSILLRLPNETQISPSITVDILTVDDDDGDLLNRTPHYPEIYHAFSPHNMVPPGMRAPKAFWVDALLGDDGSGNGGETTPYQTIQRAIDESAPFDSVKLGGQAEYVGTGNVNLRLYGRGVTVMSADPAAPAVINCQSTARAFILDENETNQSVLRNITIRNGHSLESGGGISVNESQPTIDSCTFEYCEAPAGGAISIASSLTQVSGTLITACNFISNEATNGGGGAIWIGDNVVARVSRCVLASNTSTGHGGAMASAGNGSTSLQIDSCLFDANDAIQAGGALYLGSDALVLANTIVKNRSQDLVRPSAVAIDGSDLSVEFQRNLVANNLASGMDCRNATVNVSVTCSDFWSNTPGVFSPGSTCDESQWLPIDNNLQVDPLFCSLTSGDYTLRWDSPCEATNSACGVAIGAYRAECSPPIALQVPENNGGTSDHSPTLNWYDVPMGTGTGTYRLEFARTPDFSVMQAQFDGITESQKEIQPPVTQDTWYWWRARATNQLADLRTIVGDWSETRALRIFTHGGGSCPFVYSWNGQQWMLENVILTQCEDRIEGTSVVDQLALSFRPAVIDGIYRIRIHEHEAEKSFIDNAELILVDHPVGYDAVIDAKGKVVLGRHRIVPVRVVDDLGQDVLQQLLAYDSDAYTREGRGSLVATFEGRPGEFGALAAAGEPKPLCKVSAGSARPNVGEPFNLTMEVLDVHGEWHELPRVPLRLPLAHERSFVDLSSYDLGSETKVRYSWDSHIELDELSIILEESVGYSLRTIPVSRVTHSSDHRTARLILREDGENAELVTGEFVDLEFPAQPVPDGMERSFILKAKGYYLTWYGEETANRPLEFGLNGNYPNPFNPSTTIRYSLAGDANVTLEVFNILGQRVRTLLSGELQVPGSYKIMWEGRDDFGREVGSGAYLIKLQANDFVETRKAIMLK